MLLLITGRPRRLLAELLSVGEPLGSDTVERLVPGIDLVDEERRGLVAVEEQGRRVPVRPAPLTFREVARARLPRRGVLRRAGRRRRLRDLERAPHQQIRDVHPAIRVDQHVGRLQRAVHDAPAVGVVERAGDLCDDAQARLERARRESARPLEELRGVARGLRLGAYIRLGRGEEGTGGRDKPASLADTDRISRCRRA